MANNDKIAKQLLSSMNKVIKRYGKLDDAEFFLSKNIPELKRILKKYEKELKRPLMNFFLGDGRTNSQIDKLIYQAQEDFIESVEKYGITPKSLKSNKLVNAVRSEYTNRVTSLFDTTFKNISYKINHFKAITSIAEIPAKLQQSLSVVSRQVMIGGKIYDGNKLKGLWKMMNKKYGTADTVRYKTIAGGEYNFPMKAYINMRTKTVESEVSRVVSAVEASYNGIYTGKISNHGALDSCHFWEGKIVFYSQGAKDEFIRLYPEHKQARSWPTLQEVENDQTHMFKPNCKHLISPYPVEVFPKDIADKEIKENTIPKIPKKINEQEIIERNKAA